MKHTDDTVRDVLDSCHDDMVHCIKVIHSFVMRESYEGLADDFFEFQNVLFLVIKKIETCYRELRQEEKSIKHGGMKPSSDKMTRLKHIEFLKRSLRLGRSSAKYIGDSFARLFYDKNPQLIKKHYDHPKNDMMPIGLGGVGERMMLENVKVLGKYILIHHTVTDCLRIGDASLLDIESWSIVGLVEFKTSRVDDDRIQIVAHITSSDMNLPSKIGPLKPREVSDPSVLRTSIPEEARERFNRQMINMSSAISSTLLDRDVFRSEDDEAMRAVESSVIGSSLDKICYVRASDATSVVSKRISENGKLGYHCTLRDGDVTLNKDTVTQAATDLVADGFTNSILITVLGHMDAEMQTDYRIPPLCNWRIDIKAKIDIILGRVLPITFFNEAHIWKSLKDRGFSIEIKEESTSAVKIEHNRKMTFAQLGDIKMLLSECAIGMKHANVIIDTFINRMNEVDVATQFNLDIRSSIV